MRKLTSRMKEELLLEDKSNMTSSWMIANRKISDKPINWEARFLSSPSQCNSGEATIPLYGRNGGCTGNVLCVPLSSRSPPVMPSYSSVIRHTENLYGGTVSSKICSGGRCQDATSLPQATNYLWENPTTPKSYPPPGVEDLIKRDYYNLVQRFDGTGFSDVHSALSPRYFPNHDKEFDKYYITRPDTLRVSYGTRAHVGK